MKALLPLLVGVALALVLAPAVMAQGSAMHPGLPASAAPPADVFPVWLGYAALGIVAGAGSVLGAVIKHLWTQIQQHSVDLRQEQKERREEAERLLREQREIMREVMVTCGAISEALEEHTRVLNRLVEALEEGKA